MWNMTPGTRLVVVPYYLSQGYNKLQYGNCRNQVVVPYYLSQGYNNNFTADVNEIVVVPYYLSQGYNTPSSSYTSSNGCSSLLSLSRV